MTSREKPSYVTPSEEQEFILALQYIRDNPVFREVVRVLLEYVGEELNEIREAAGLRPKARTKMVRAAVDHAKNNFNKRKKHVPDTPGTEPRDYS